MKKISRLFVLCIVVIGVLQLSCCVSATDSIATDNTTIGNESVKDSYSEVVKTLPISLSKAIPLQTISSEGFPSSHNEAIELANDYLNATLGSDFVKSHFEVLGIDERPDMPSVWLVLYKYKSSGYEINLSLSVDVSGRPRDPSRIINESWMIDFPQEIKLSQSDAETIASEKGLTSPYSTDLSLYWKEKRIAWRVAQDSFKELGEIKGYIIDAESGKIFAELSECGIVPPPTSEKRNATDFHKFISYSKIQSETVTTRSAIKHSSSSIYIESVDVLVEKITIDEDVTIEIWSKNSKSSTHKLYHKLITTAPDGKVQTSESSHLDVPSGSYLHTTFTKPDNFCGLVCPPFCENCGFGSYTFDVELWEDIHLGFDIKHDSNTGNNYYRIFERPSGVSANYYCDDSWHHPSNIEIYNIALQQAAGAKTPHDAADKLKSYVNGFIDYDKAEISRSSDLELIHSPDPKGACIDFGDLYIGLVRSIDIPTRATRGDMYSNSGWLCSPKETNICGVYCNLFPREFGHAWAESYYSSNWHHIDPTWNNMENPRVYYGSGSLWCVAHVRAFSWTYCGDNFENDCARIGGSNKLEPGWIEVTTLTDGGYDTSIFCPSDIDSDGTCDNFDPDKDGDGILNDPDPCPCWWAPITSPTTASPASAGAFDNPSHIDTTVEVKKGTIPITGLTIANFTFKIGGKTATASLTDTSIPGTYKFDVTPPTQVAAGKYDLDVTVTYNWCGSTDTEQEAVEYTSSYSLDLIFTIDTTGSMWDDIAYVKASASAIADEVLSDIPTARIAVVDYRDFPVSPYGGAGDYPYNDVLSFSTDKPAIVAAIQGLTLGWGADWRESVYSALMHSIDSTSLGSWRGSDQAAKVIILMGDAPPHDPEPFTGYTLSLVSTAAELADPVIIYPIQIGGTVGKFEELADQTGGKAFTAGNAGEVVDAILEALEEIKTKPIAVANGPYTGFVGESITFDGTGSYDLDGIIVNYEWDLDDDGVFDDATGATPTITFDGPYSGDIHLQVTDDDGATDIDSTTLTVSAIANQPPIADANGPYTGFVGESITFDGTASYDPDSTIVSYEWDLDNDGEFDDATGATPVITFDEPYLGNIHLKVTDDKGATDVDTTTLTVKIPATVDFDPDTLNLKSKGRWVTIYIEFPESYDVADINASTILVNNQAHAEMKPIEVGDYDFDGTPDLMVKFDRADVQELLEAGDAVDITVVGELYDGSFFAGNDTIRVIHEG